MAELNLLLVHQNLPRLFDDLLEQLPESTRAELREIFDRNEDADFQLMAWDETELQYRVGTTVFHFPLEELNRPPDPSQVAQN